MHRAQSLYTAPPTDDAALVTRHAQLISRVARRIALRIGTPGLEDDLWSVGALGLIDAARRFDSSRDVKFETFAEHRIRGAMLDELRKLDHLPRRLRAETDKVVKAKKKLIDNLGREGTQEEVARVTGLEMESLAELESLLQPHVPLTSDVDIADTEQSAEERMNRLQRVRRLTQVVATLPERLQMILSLRYTEEFTYKEIAKLLEVSEARVCQLHADAVEQIRSALE